jgi:hypothetical protein
MESPGTITPDAPGAVATAQAASVERRGELESCGLPLTSRRQKRFHSAKCRTLHWEALHPRVSPTHTARVRTGSLKAAVLECLADGAFRTVQQIAEATGGLPASVSARIREARAEGANILRDELVGHVEHAHRYRLVPRG